MNFNEILIALTILVSYELQIFQFICIEQTHLFTETCIYGIKTNSGWIEKVSRSPVHIHLYDQII